MKSTAFHVLASILLLIVFSGCGVRRESPEAYLAWRGIEIPATPELTVCSEFGCKLQATVGLNDTDILFLQNHFLPHPANALDERLLVASAVAYLERVVGPRAGTERDLARNARNRARYGQLDCIAEAANTTVYLLLLKQLGHLVFHDVAPPESRGGSVFTAHNTAVIKDRAGSEFAVDSWFHPNGALPEVVPLENWRNGFQPLTPDPQPTRADVETELEPANGV